MAEIQYKTVAETAEILQLDKETILRNLRAGKLPGVKVGKSWRVPFPLPVNNQPPATK